MKKLRFRWLAGTHAEIRYVLYLYLIALGLLVARYFDWVTWPAWY